jgi:transcription initiation factor TFIIB
VTVLALTFPPGRNDVPRCVGYIQKGGNPMADEEKVDEITKCPECKSSHLVRDYERGELVCEDCGLVLDEQFVDQGPEWRAFDAEQGEKRARTGAPMTYTIHDKGLSTEIGWKNKDSYGKSIPTRNRAQLYRLRKWQRRIRVSNATERNLAFALSELDRMASGMGLPRNVRETAAMIYRKAVNKNLIRGRSIEGVVAASLYAACRQCNVPRTLDEIASASRVGRKEIGRTYRFMTRELKLRLMPTSPQDYISRFCSELKLSGDVQTKTIDILKQADQKELTSGRGPTGVAAAAVYISSILCNERRTQREVADIAGVTEVTIRNRYKELTEKLGLEVNL